MTKTILLTRPRASSERWASLLAQHGFVTLIEPLLVIEATHVPRPQGTFQAVIFTSANAPDALNPLEPTITDLLHLPCFCVGTATGEAARDRGFTDITCGASDGVALATMIKVMLKDKNRPLLYIAGDFIDPKVISILTGNGFTLVPWSIYRTQPVDHFTARTRDRFAAGEIAMIPVFSPRSARILIDVIEKSGLTQVCYRVTAIGLSQAVADVLKFLPWRRLHVAATPSAHDVIACLHTEFSMNMDEKNPPPSLLPAYKRQKQSFLLAWTGFIFLAVLSAALLSQCPFLFPSSPPHPNARAETLEKRVDSLEAKLNALTEISALAPAPINDAALADTVNNLQNQITQMQSQGMQSEEAAHHWVAAAFAFWDLREAAEKGTPFVSELASLRKASDDPALSEQAAKLDLYASTSTPTLAQLRDQLITLEASSPSPVGQGGTSSLEERIKAAFGTLISVHSLHHPEFADLEKALMTGSAEAAFDAFRFLPSDTQHNLAAWGSQLEARTTIDNTLAAMSTLFTAPMVTTGHAP